MSGTKIDEQTLSATDTADTEFEGALSKAVYEGNTAEIDRLMALAPTDTTETTDTEEAVSTEESGTSTASDDTSNKDDTVSGQDQETDNTEAAPSAASTASSVNEEVEALKRELHKVKSDAGRVQFLQRRQAELEREVRAYKAREVAPTQQANGTPVKADYSKVELDPDVQKDIDELKEIDPVLARTMERVAKAAVAAASQQVNHAVTTFTQQDQESEDFKFYVEQKSRLVEMIPQAEAIFQTPEWRNWKESLTPAKRGMAESGYADEVAQAIHAFAADMHRLNGGQQAAVQTTTEQVVTPPQVNTEVTEARQRKVATSAEARSTSAKKGETFDVDAAFREIYNSVAKQNHIL